MNNLKIIARLLKEYRIHQAIITIILMGELCLAMLSPLLMKELIDEITLDLRQDVIFRLGITLVIVGLGRVIIDGIQNYYWHWIRYNAINTLRYKIFRNIIDKHISFFNSTQSGEISTKILDDTVIVAQSIVIGVPMLIYNLLNIIIIIIIMFIFSKLLAVIVLLSLPIYVFIFNKINKSLRENSTKERESYSKIRHEVHQNLLGIRTIKFSKQERFFSNKFKKLIDNYFKDQRSILKFNTIGSSTTNLIITMLPLIILVVGATLVSESSITVGTLLAFYSYLGYIYEPLNNLSDFCLGTQTSIATSDRLIEFINSNEEEVQIKVNDSKPIETIEFKDINFSYDRCENILEEFSLKIESGQIVGLDGASGKGKSTILNLLMKIYKVDRGKILINNINLKEYNEDVLYSKIAIVDQFPFIFNSSIKENIIFNGKVEECKLGISLAMSQADQFIDGLERGIDTEILESGRNLSGGQKQRVCISRALSKEFDVLVLDEAFSALDKNSSKEIMDTLIKYIKANNKILIIVTHNKELMKLCDKIVSI